MGPKARRVGAKSRYANAADVLPAPLVQEIQKSFVGLLWVPTKGITPKHRRELVVHLRSERKTLAEIARRAGITRRHVSKLLALDTDRKIEGLLVIASDGLSARTRKAKRGSPGEKKPRRDRT